MGFRGEALSSIASCAKLTITSCSSIQDSAMILEVEDGKLIRLEAGRGKQGTTVQVKDLFYSMPGRKNFLKSASSESAQCRSVFIEKALPHIHTAFRYFTEGNLKIFLPASDLKTRVLSAFSGNHAAGFYFIF